jgi:hypothetical protein
MAKFIALYLTPPSVLDDWAKTPADEKKAAEEKMMADWNAWMAAHGKMILNTEVGGKTKTIAPGGVTDTRNDIMLYSFIEADSHEAAAKAFEGHPHLGIPQATIEVMAVREMGPM